MAKTLHDRRSRQSSSLRKQSRYFQEPFKKRIACFGGGGFNVSRIVCGKHSQVIFLTFKVSKRLPGWFLAKNSFFSSRSRSYLLFRFPNSCSLPYQQIIMYWLIIKWSFGGTGLLHMIIERDRLLQMIIRRGRPLANDYPERPASCQ